MREVQRARSAAATLGVESAASDEDDGDESIGGAVRRSAAYAYAMEARAWLLRWLLCLLECILCLSTIRGRVGPVDRPTGP